MTGSPDLWIQTRCSHEYIFTSVHRIHLNTGCISSIQCRHNETLCYPTHKRTPPTLTHLCVTSVCSQGILMSPTPPPPSSSVLSQPGSSQLAQPDGLFAYRAAIIWWGSGGSLLPPGGDKQQGFPNEKEREQSVGGGVMHVSVCEVRGWGVWVCLCTSVWK